MELIKLRVAVDSDGVCMDFNKHVLDLFGCYPSAMPDDDMWELILHTPDFWPTMPVKYGAHELWNLVQPYSPFFLTGCPKNHYEVAAAHKVTLLKRHFGADAEG